MDSNFIDKSNLDFDSEFLINALREIEPIIFIKDTDARYIFCNHHKEKTKFDNGHKWDIYGLNDLECRDDIENAITVHKADLEMLKNGKKCEYVIAFPTNGKTSYFSITKSPIYKDGKIAGIIGLIVDITEREEYKRQLEKAVYTDDMTGLYNRKYFYHWLENINNEKLYPITLISSDCNYLKMINDTYGHLMGDQYIRMMSTLLNRELPHDSLKFRMGGDEFLALLPNTTLEEGKNYINKLRECSKELVIKSHELSASYGLSIIEEYTTNMDQYLKAADDEMYQEKQKVHSLRK